MAPDLTNIDGVVSALYQAVSFEKGGEPDYRLLELLFHDGARVIQPVEDTSGVLKPMCFSDFIDSFQATLRDQKLIASGGREEEVERVTNSFGRVAHVLSSYHFMLGGSDVPLARGVNALQLIFDSERWWILSVAWDRAKSGESLAFIERRI